MALAKIPKISDVENGSAESFRRFSCFFYSNKTKTRAYLSERLHFLLSFRYRTVIGVFELFLSICKSKQKGSQLPKKRSFSNLQRRLSTFLPYVFTNLFILFHEKQTAERTGLQTYYYKKVIYETKTFLRVIFKGLYGYSDFRIFRARFQHVFNTLPLEKD